MENNYYKFGVNKPVSPDVLDPVDSCLSSSKYFNTANPLRFDAQLCNDFMTQRCSQKWDSKCDKFIVESNDKYTPKIVDGLPPSDFLEIVARKKYCMLDSSDPDAKCVQLCEPMNPIDQTSAQVCSIYGTEIYQNDSLLKDIAGDFPATAKLTNYSPIKITKCPVVCNGVDKIEENDIVIDRCLDSGRCMDVMMQLARYAAKNNTPVNNQKFKKFMDYYNSLNPQQKEIMKTNIDSLLLVPQNSSIPQKFGEPLDIFKTKYQDIDSDSENENDNGNYQYEFPQQHIDVKSSVNNVTDYISNLKPMNILCFILVFVLLFFIFKKCKGLKK